MANPQSCQHKNIVWEDFFKKDKIINGEVNNKIRSNNAYCLDCNENKGKMFAISLQNWYCKKIEDWLKDNDLLKEFTNNRGEKIYSNVDFIIFLRKNNYEHVWWDLKKCKIDDDYFTGFGGQMLFQEFSMWIEDCCRKFKEEKQNTPNTPQPRERNKPIERERESKFSLKLAI